MKQVELLHSQNINNVKIDLKNDPRNAVKLLRQDVLELIESTHENSTIAEKRYYYVIFKFEINYTDPLDIMLLFFLLSILLKGLLRSINAQV